MKKKIMLALVSLTLVFSMAACGKHADGSTEKEQDSSAVVEEENTPTDGSDGEIAETEETKSYEIGEILSDLTVGDINIGWPCELEDIKKVFELGNAYSFEDIPDVLCYDLYSDGNKVGTVWISEDKSSVLILSLTYRLNDGIPFEFKGVTESSSYSDVISLLGTPTYQSEEGYRNIDYYDVKQDRTEAFTYDEISMNFKDDHIYLIEFYCSKENEK